MGRRGGTRRDRSWWVFPFPSSPARHVLEVPSALTRLDVPDGFMRRWVLASLTAAALASAPSIVRWALGLDDFGRPTPAPLLSPGVVFDSALEGLLLGFAQWWVLREVLPALTWRSWMGATVIGGTVAGAAGSLPLAISGVRPDFAPGELDGASALQLLVLVPVSLFLVLALTGVLQSLVLERYVTNAQRWIRANMFGNLLGAATALVVLVPVMSLSGTPLTRPSNAVTSHAWLASGVVGLIAAGVVSAIITGRAIRRLVPRLLPVNAQRSAVNEA